MYLFSHLCQYLLVDIYFTLWVIIQYCVPYFVVQIVSALAVGDFFSCSCVPLTWPVSVGVLSIPCFMASKLFRPRLVCPPLQPGRGHFSREPWLLLLEGGDRSRDLDAGCARCY